MLSTPPKRTKIIAMVISEGREMAPGINSLLRSPGGGGALEPPELTWGGGEGDTALRPEGPLPSAQLWLGGLRGPPSPPPLLPPSFTLRLY